MLFIVEKERKKNKSEKSGQKERDRDEVECKIFVFSKMFSQSKTCVESVMIVTCS